MLLLSGQLLDLVIHEDEGFAGIAVLFVVNRLWNWLAVFILEYRSGVFVELVVLFKFGRPPCALKGFEEAAAFARRAFVFPEMASPDSFPCLKQVLIAG